jgi:ParB family transcriptional regulator, chromosome partitioning protein
MSRQQHAEVMQEKRAESLSRRPVLAVAAVGSQERKYEGRRKHAAACEIAVDRIIADPNQPRQEFEPEALAQLATSMKSVGQITPIQVRWSDADECYVIIAGERRWRAAKDAGLPLLKCVAIEGEMTPDKLVEMQLMENACRKDLTFAEQGRAFKTLMETRHLTQRDLAEMLRIDQANIAHAVALLTLPDEIMAAVEAKKIVPSTAYEISKAADPEVQLEIARDVVENGSSRAVVRDRVAKAKPKKPGGIKATGKAKPVTLRSFKTPMGIRITAERGKGMDPLALVEALRDAANQAEAELSGPDEEVA